MRRYILLIFEALFLAASCNMLYICCFQFLFDVVVFFPFSKCCISLFLNFGDFPSGRRKLTGHLVVDLGVGIYSAKPLRCGDQEHDICIA